jgi:hypothetical protein
MDFFIKGDDEKLAKNATFLDDLDMIPSKRHVGPWGPCIVTVAVKAGVHVCWQCGRPFSSFEKGLRGEEVQLGTAYVLLHEKCVCGPNPKSYRSFSDVTRGLQARRFFANTVKKMGEVLGVDPKKDE